MLPNFIHIGTAKSASTWLWSVYKEHPEIYVPFEKVQNYSGSKTKPDNVNFWIGDWDRGIGWYEETYFSQWKGEKAVGEFSNGYIHDEQALIRIKNALPGVRLTVILRNPLERAYLHCAMQYRKSKGASEAFRRVFDIHSWMQYRAFIEPGFYHYQISRVFKHFDRSSVLIQFYDDLKADTSKFLKQAYDFLGVCERYDLPSVNKIIGWPRPDNNDTEDGDLARGIPQEIADRILKHYADDISRLEDLLKRDLSAWKTYRHPA